MLALYRSGRQAEALEAYHGRAARTRRRARHRAGARRSSSSTASILRQEDEPRARAAADARRTTTTRTSSTRSWPGGSCRRSAPGSNRRERQRRRACPTPARGRRAPRATLRLPARARARPRPRLRSTSRSRRASARSTTSSTRCCDRELRARARVAPSWPRSRGAASRARARRDQLIVTTNFDHALERAFAEAGEEVDVVSYVALGRNRGKFLHLGRRGRARRSSTCRTRTPALSLGAAHRRPEDPRPGRPRPGARVGELRRQRGRLHRLPRAGGDLEPSSRSRSPPGCGGATSSSSATRSTTGACACSCTGSGGDETVGYRSWAVEPEPEPLEPRALAPARGRRLRRPLDEYVADLARAASTEPTSGGVTRDAPPRPYKGLMPFEDSELDVLFFFGREREREIIVANLMASRLTVLYGETGVGKSSVLRAGVAHHLRAERRDGTSRSAASRRSPSCVFDRWRDDPVEGIARGRCARRVRGALGREVAAPERDGSLADRLDAWATRPRRRPLPHPRPDRGVLPLPRRRHGPARSRDELAEVVERARPARAACSSRSARTRVAKLDRFKGPIPNVLGNYLRLDHLDRAAGRGAIVGPIAPVQRASPATGTSRSRPTLVEAVLDAGRAGHGSSSAPAGRGDRRGRRPNAAHRDAVPPARHAAALGRGAQRPDRSVLRARDARAARRRRADRRRPPRAQALERARRRETGRRRLASSTTSSRRPARRSPTAPRDLPRYAGVEERSCSRCSAALGDARILRPVAGDGGGLALRDLPRRARRPRCSPGGRVTRPSASSTGSESARESRHRGAFSACIVGSARCSSR